MPVDPYARVVRDGKVLDALTERAIMRAEKALGRRIPITQGSYNAGGVAASAGTHDGGGVVDVPAWEHDATVTALRAVGFAAWYRPAIAGLWPAHIHAVLIGHGRLAPSAARQVQAYLARRDGLASNRIDTDPGWTNTARYTVEGFRADVERESLNARIAHKSEKRGRLKRIRARIASELAILRARRRSLPK